MTTLWRQEVQGTAHTRPGRVEALDSVGPSSHHCMSRPSTTTSLTRSVPEEIGAERGLDGSSPVGMIPDEPDGRRHPGGAGTKRRTGGPTAPQSHHPRLTAGVMCFGARYAALRGGAWCPPAIKRMTFDFSPNTGCFLLKWTAAHDQFKKVKSP